jgi:hypothetical protein
MQCFANTPDRCTRKAIVKQVEKRREYVERISVLDLSTISLPIDYVEESKTDMYSGVDRPSVQTTTGTKI